MKTLIFFFLVSTFTFQSVFAQSGNKITQQTDLKTGWNIISFNVTPDTLDMKVIFKSLINDKSLIKVQDEIGKSLEDYGIFGGWTNNIGDMALTEGYKVKVTKDCQLNIQGIPAVVPFPIPLKAGWNIIGYPKSDSANALSVVKELIDRKTLIKVQDETGKSIEDFGIFGGWTNNIGHFKPGEGYKTKVSKDEVLYIVNQPPFLPSHPVPADSSKNVSEKPVVSWLCSDPERDSLWYDVYFGTSYYVLEIVSKDQVSATFKILDTLNFGSTYYWKINAKDSKGNITDGRVWKFTVRNETGSFMDLRDSTVYNTVKIGDQWWMAQNLAWLPSVNLPETGSDFEKYYYVYGYSGTDVAKAKATPNYSSYGVLYNWTAAMNGLMSSSANPSGIRGACPEGWHLPSMAEWNALSDYLFFHEYGFGGSGRDIAKSMASRTNWNSSSVTGTPGCDPQLNNSSGFTGLPGGIRSVTFKSLGNDGNWWTSEEGNASNAADFILGAGSKDLYKSDYVKSGGMSIRCVKGMLSEPLVSTFKPDSVACGSAILGGNITYDGNDEITGRGICYGSTHTPTLGSGKMEMGSGIGVFRAKVTGFASGITWFVRAYAIANHDTLYGNEMSFKTCEVYPVTQFTDPRDGRIYKTVSIGSFQLWMAENLAYLPQVNSPSESSQTEKCFYVYGYSGNDVSAAKATPDYIKYGALYNWSAAVNGAAGSNSSPSGVRGVCPEGWHLPSDTELKLMEMTLGMTSTQADLTGWRGTDQGSRMKTTTGWYNNGNGTNSSGFSCLPGGACGNGVFMGIGEIGYWWSTSEYLTSEAWCRRLDYKNTTVYRDRWGKETGFSVRCIKDNYPYLIVATRVPETITTNSAQLGGKITFDCWAEVTERGVCYGTVQNPTIAGNKSAMGGGTGQFSGKVSGLTSGTIYYVRAYAITSQGVVYGDEQSFKTAAEVPSGTFTDPRDGRTYKWVQIGTQVWMSENLAWLPVVSPPTVGSNAEKYYYVYNYSGTDVSAAKATANYATYGVLYNWSAALNGAASSSANPSGVQGACPPGWHLPSEAEWKTLINYLGGESVAGGKMKETGIIHWNSPNNGATNESGFTGIPGGDRLGNGVFANFGNYGNWWSSEEFSTTHAPNRRLDNYNAGVWRDIVGKEQGFSLRCVRDN